MQARQTGRTALPALMILSLLTMVALTGCGSSGGGGTGETTTGGQGGANAGAETSSAAPAPGQAPPGASVETCAAGGSGGAVRVVGASCKEGRAIATAWARRRACAPAAGGSHGSCTIGRYGCIATKTDRGIEVSCARSGQAISFTRPG